MSAKFSEAASNKNKLVVLKTKISRKMQKRTKYLLLISAGLLLLSLSQMAWHYLRLPDFINGALIGAGIGLMFIALLNKKNRVQKEHS